MQEKTQKTTDQKISSLVSRPAFFPMAGAALATAIHCNDWRRGIYENNKALLVKEGLGLIFLLSFASFGVGSVVGPLLSKKPIDPLTKVGTTAGLALGGGVALMSRASSFTRMPVGEMICLTLLYGSIGAAMGKTLNNSGFYINPSHAEEEHLEKKHEFNSLNRN